MITSVSTVLTVSVWLVVVMTLYVLLYRKHIFSFYDPLLFFLLTNTLTTILMFMQVSQVSHLVYFVFCQLALWLGITSFRYRLEREEIIQFSSFNIKLLQSITYTLFVIYLLANLYAASRVGFPLLTDDPTASKTAVYVGGLGIVRRINWGASIFLSCACFVMLFISRRKAPFVLILLCQVAFTILSGSKGGLLAFVFMLAYIIKRPGFQVRMNLSTLRKYKKYLTYFFVSGVSVALLVLYIERGNVGGALMGLYNRLLLSGDVILYYYQPHIHRQISEAFSPIDYPLHEFNSILGLFRLAEYQNPLGYEMLVLHLKRTGEAIPLIPIGPNTQFFAKGQIFFGLGGILYSLVVGLLIGFLRKDFFVTKKFSLVRFTFAYALVVMAFTYAIESNLFVSQVFDLLIFVVPVLVLCYGALKMSEVAQTLHEEENSYLGH